ncbi:MAG: DUF2914 domain-containing protein [Sulfuricaulis sp.]
MDSLKKPNVMSVFRVLLLGAGWLACSANAGVIGTVPAAGRPAATAIVPATSATPPAVAVSGNVTRAVFTTDVKDHKPIDSLTSLTNDKTRVCYFTVIVGMAAQTVTHRWEYHGKLMLEKPFKVSASYWRAYSCKTLNPSWLGEWKASTVDVNGSSLSVNTFIYVKKPDAAAASNSTR